MVDDDLEQRLESMAQSNGLMYADLDVVDKAVARLKRYRGALEQIAAFKGGTTTDAVWRIELARRALQNEVKG